MDQIIYKGKTLKYVNRLSEETGKVFMFLNGEISNGEYKNGEYTVDSNFFAYELHYLWNEGFHPTVIINSPGGSITKGFNIMDAVIRTKADTLIIMAASMAGVISQFGKTRFAYPFSSLMIHPVSGNGAQQAFVDMLAEQLRNELIRRSNITEEDVNEMLKDGAGDTWFSLLDSFADNRNMLTMGLIDRVIQPFEDDLEIIETEQIPTIDNLDFSSPTSKLYQIYNNAIHIDMDKPDFRIVKNTLGLDSSASEDTVNQSIVDLKKEKSDAEQKAKDEKKRADEAEAKLTEFQKKRAEDAVTALIDQKIIEEADKDDMIDFATNDFDRFQKVYKTRKPVEKPRSSIVDFTEGDDKKDNEPENRENWTYSDYINKDEKALVALAKDEPEKFAKLAEAHAATV